MPPYKGLKGCRFEHCLFAATLGDIAAIDVRGFFRRRRSPYRLALRWSIVVRYSATPVSFAAATGRYILRRHYQFVIVVTFRCRWLLAQYLPSVHIIETGSPPKMSHQYACHTTPGSFDAATRDA